MKWMFTLIAIVAWQMDAGGQAIGLYGLEKAGNKGFCIQYQNDAFGKTDYYYSQGVQVAATIPSRKRTWLPHLLPTLHNGSVQYGIALEHDAYTPTSILSDSILYGDRPYAASFMLQCFGFSTPETGRGQLSTMLSIGMMGPVAGGEEIQAGIHRNTNNDIPHGWQFQIRNDVILNYSLHYAYPLLRARDVFAATAFGGLDAGTYNNKVTLGLNVKAGLLQRTFIEEKQEKFHFYVEDKGSLQLVGYDATLQGGVFNRTSPYTIAAGNVSRIVFKNNIAVNLGWRQCTLSANFTWLSPEFNTGRSHAWGGLQISYRL